MSVPFGHSDTQERSRQNPELDSLLKSGYRLTPATMAVKLTEGQWIPARHLLHISTIVATELAKGNARIIVTMPPRHGKSEFLSINTVLWFLDRWPQKHVILSTYGADLSTDFSRKVRDTVWNKPDLLRVRLRQDTKNVQRFLTTEGGGVFAVGIGGPITGRGADLLLVDDYTKNAEDSMSELQRQKSYDWFVSTAYTRLEPGGSCIILATRWNMEDLIGRLIEEHPGTWRLINLPAFAEEEDPLGREPGEPLWPERYDAKALEGIRTVLGSYWFEAMYQQRPRSSMSGQDLGDALQICSPADVPHRSNLRAIRAWDFAASESKGDYTAGPLMAMDKDSGKVFILDMHHFQRSPWKTELIVHAAAMGDGPGVQVWIEQEPGSSGKALVEHYQKDILKGFVCSGQRPTGPLEVRASPFLAAVEAGLVYMLPGSWNQALRREVNSFPDGAHDDQVAALALAYDKLLRKRFGSVIWGEDRFFAKVNRPQLSQGIVTGAVW